MEAEMARMEAERLTLLAGHSSSEEESDDDLDSMHIDLSEVTRTITYFVILQYCVHIFIMILRTYF
jgi:hypothetical protein